MEPALKQRLLGAAVLVALAVTFLPMLVMDPAPESGASDVPLKVPKAPEDDIETHELPLIEPAADAGPALAPALPPAGTVAPPEAAGVAPSADGPTPGGMLPAPTAGGDYAVSFGSYATAADAQRVVGSLRASQLPGYADAVQSGARTLHRVRIGPYATRGEAEAARLRAAHVRDDVGAKVVVLDAGTTPAGATAATRAEAPTANRTVATATRPGATPSATPSPPTASAPPTPSEPSAPPAPPPAAKAPSTASVGFAVQLGAFANAAEAQRLQDRARGAGFSAFVEPVRTENGTLHRVRIGPAADRAEADRLRAQAASRLGVSGIVRPHP